MTPDDSTDRVRHFLRKLWNRYRIEGDPRPAEEIEEWKERLENHDE